MSGKLFKPKKSHDSFGCSLKIGGWFNFLFRPQPDRACRWCRESSYWRSHLYIYTAGIWVIQVINLPYVTGISYCSEIPKHLRDSSLNIDISPIHDSPLGGFRLWWHSLIYAPLVKFHGWKEFHPMDACCSQGFNERKKKSKMGEAAVQFVKRQRR